MDDFEKELDACKSMHDLELILENRIERAKLMLDIFKKYSEDKMTEREKVTQLKKILFEHFQSDAKVNLWLITSNPMLGGMTPEDFIRVGRIDKLLKFVETAKDENKRDDIKAQ